MMMAEQLPNSLVRGGKVIYYLYIILILFSKHIICAQSAIEVASDLKTGRQKRRR